MNLVLALGVADVIFLVMIMVKPVKVFFLEPSSKNIYGVGGYKVSLGKGKHIYTHF